MHETQDERNIMPSLASEIKECISCGRTMRLIHYRRDSTYRDGRRDQCEQCESSPRLSTSEHTARMREMNLRSQAVKSQMWEHQEMFEDNSVRDINRMHHSEFLRRLAPIVNGQLYLTEGRIVGDLSVFRTFGSPQKHLEGRSFEYLFYIPTGYMPEHSLIEFNNYGAPVKESQRGWRTPLLRLIKANIVSAQDVEQIFGPALGEGAANYNRQLYIHRNGVLPD